MESLRDPQWRKHKNQGCRADASLPVGARLRLGGDVLVEMTQKGKECREECFVFFEVGECAMPGEGVFAEVLEGGQIAAGDTLEVLEDSANETGGPRCPSRAEKNEQPL